MRTTTGVPRGFIIFAQIFGTFFMVTGTIAMLAAFDEIFKYGEITGAQQSGVAALMAFMVYMSWKSIWSCVVILKAMRSMDDITLSANKWMISALSLTLGGIFTPFVMSAFPNVNIRSTISPKVFLTKAFGMIMMVGAPLAMITYGVYAGTSGFMSESGTGTATGLTFGIYGVLTLLGILDTAMFWGKDASSRFYDNGFMKFLSVVTLIIITFDLILVLVESLLTLLRGIESMVDGFQDNFWIGLLYLINLSITFLFTGMVMVVTWQTMVGIWKDEVDYKVFEPLKNKQDQASYDL